MSKAHSAWPRLAGARGHSSARRSACRQWRRPRSARRRAGRARVAAGGAARLQGGAAGACEAPCGRARTAPVDGADLGEGQADALRVLGRGVLLQDVCALDSVRLRAASAPSARGSTPGSRAGRAGRPAGRRAGAAQRTTGALAGRPCGRPRLHVGVAAGVALVREAVDRVAVQRQEVDVLAGRAQHLRAPRGSAPRPARRRRLASLTARACRAPPASGAGDTLRLRKRATARMPRPGARCHRASGAPAPTNAHARRPCQPGPRCPSSPSRWRPSCTPRPAQDCRIMQQQRRVRAAHASAAPQARDDLAQLRRPVGQRGGVLRRERAAVVRVVRVARSPGSAEPGRRAW